MLAGTLKTHSGVEFGRWMCQILLEQQVMVTHARCKLAAVGLKSPAAGSLSPPPSVGLKGCFVGPMRAHQTQSLVTFTLLLALHPCLVPHCHNLNGVGVVEGASFTACTVGLGW